MTALARHLQMRGHEVVFLYSSGAAGLPFIPDEEVERVISERSADLSEPVSVVSAAGGRSQNASRHTRVCMECLTGLQLIRHSN